MNTKFIIPVILLLVYLFTRLYNILSLPIFNDEAIYIRFAQTIARDPASLFVPLAQPNEPLFMWFNALIYDYFENPLLGGRIISVIAGLGNMAGIYMIGKEYFSRNAGFLGAIFYIILPYTLIFDRMAHVDSLLNFFNIWFTYVVLRVFHETLSFKKGALIAGVLAGGALLAKSSALLFLVMPLFYLPFTKPDKKKFYFLAVVYVTGFILFSPVLLAKQGPVLSGGNKVLHNVKFIHNIPELIALPFQTWKNSLFEIAGYYVKYISLPILLLSLYGIYSRNTSSKNIGLIFFMWFLFPTLFFLILAKFSYSRWLLFCSSPVIIAAGAGADAIKNHLKNRVAPEGAFLPKPGILFFSILVCGPSLFFASKLLIDPTRAPWVEADEEQYIRNEYSGYGINGLVDFFKKAGKINPIMVLASDNWGNPGDALFLYLEKDKNIEIFTSWWWAEKPVMPKGRSLVQLYKNKYSGEFIYREFPLNSKSVYFVCRSVAFPKKDFLVINPDFRHIGTFSKPGNQKGYDLYKWSGRFP